ncbi:protein phosphatase 2C domain-containing protein [Actinomadura viridis]|uniref:Serine/threonine protein phosphatase PrpC n=1 Tax=Actinomadura viridis TaxID=58110 RepID=A0A931DJG3_9ACTN|nr:protein phosphatase 2C domain-containing protein [Actinomadura viridis]MBG6087803.1 serine/threonine protein phosphatase PrpC [Actinomadura viridis]
MTGGSVTGEAAGEPAKTAELTCPACAEVVFAGEDFCEACGQRLGKGAPVAGTAQPRAVPAGPSCASCGEGPIDADGYCERCGLRQPAERDHVEIELPGRAAAGVSDRGRRYSRNEDALALSAHPAGVAVVVSDGVGSSPRPDDASRAAADHGVAELEARLEAGDAPEAAVRAAVARAAGAVAALAESPAEAPSCTFVCAVTSHGSVTVGWVGDSRAYWLAAGAAGSRALTEDDSWAAYMVAEGTMTEAEAEAHPNAHVITGWLGADAEEVRPHVAAFTPDPGAPGTLLVCSDGLWNYLPKAADLAAVLSAASADPAADPLGAARALVRHALDAGGRDNITVAVVPLPLSPSPSSMERER